VRKESLNSSDELPAKKARVEDNAGNKIVSFEEIAPHLFEMERQGDLAKLVKSNWRGRMIYEYIFIHIQICIYSHISKHRQIVDNLYIHT
jgi:hypothetical protein